MADIYYHYSKETGEYMGSGVEEINNAVVGSTPVEPPQFEQNMTTFDFITMPYYVNDMWEIRSV